MPALVHVDDILFRKPVEIGSLLYFSSQVVYTQGHYVMIRVTAEVVQPENGTHDLTNVFHFTLKTDSQVPEVIPRTYQGKKIFHRRSSSSFFFHYLIPFNPLQVPFQWRQIETIINKKQNGF